MARVSCQVWVPVILRLPEQTGVMTGIELIMEHKTCSYSVSCVFLILGKKISRMWKFNSVKNNKFNFDNNLLCFSFVISYPQLAHNVRTQEKAYTAGLNQWAPKSQKAFYSFHKKRFYAALNDK